MPSLNCFTWFRPRKAVSEHRVHNAEHKSSLARTVDSDSTLTDTKDSILPDKQAQLLLHAKETTYVHTEDQPIPEILADDELLVKVDVVGLNPIDWKAPAFGYGLPPLPCVSGRDFVGTVVKQPRIPSRIRQGDRVLSIATDYRDYRKSAFQNYAVSAEHTAARLPAQVSDAQAAPIGVAFVSAALALGVCLGIDFTQSKQSSAPDLLRLVKGEDATTFSEDVKAECVSSIEFSDRPKRGDWLTIWGASTTVGFIALQLAKLAGLRVICIANAKKHGNRLVEAGADVLVHRDNIEDAVEIVKAVTNGKLRFALDTVGKETATELQKALSKDSQSHLVGLTGLPKEREEHIKYHSVPIKVFHEHSKIGNAVVRWLEEILEEQGIQFPTVEIADGGLEGVNAALEILRSGKSSSQRIVVPLSKSPG